MQISLWKFLFSVLVAHIPSNVSPEMVCLLDSDDCLVQRRNLLRLTAKSTQFGKRTFTSWLIEAAGTVPIQRRKDFADGHIDNTNVMQNLLQVRDSRTSLYG